MSSAGHGLMPTSQRDDRYFAEAPIVDMKPKWCTFGRDSASALVSDHLDLLIEPILGHFHLPMLDVLVHLQVVAHLVQGI
jgi:hypothetical protein